MKLLKKDKELLKRWGYLEEDFEQIQMALIKTTYELNDKKISRTKAVEILGRELYLSGIARSAFHRSAVRYKEERNMVYFNSRKLYI